MTLNTYIPVLLLALLLSATSFSDAAYPPRHGGKPPHNPLTEQHNSEVNGYHKPPRGRPPHNPLAEDLSQKEQHNSDVNGYPRRKPPIHKPPPITTLQNELSVNTESSPKGRKKHDPPTVLKKPPYEPGHPVVVENVPPKKRKPPQDNTETTPRKHPRNPPTTN